MLTTGVPSVPAQSLSLRFKQQLFARLFGKLLAYATAQGWSLRMGEGYVGDSIDKPTEDTPHIRHGNHFNRLAIDLLLDVNDTWVTTAHPIYMQLGAYWESLHPVCRWGGNFASKDYDHFSFEHNGVA